MVCHYIFYFAVFFTLDKSIAISLTGPGQCRLSPCILVVLDTSQLYDHLVKILSHLHSCKLKALGYFPQYSVHGKTAVTTELLVFRSHQLSMSYSRNCQPVLYKEPKSIEAVTERAVTQLLLQTSALSLLEEVGDLFFLEITHHNTEASS